jgi:hypothetical protein
MVAWVHSDDCAMGDWMSSKLIHRDCYGLTLDPEICSTAGHFFPESLGDRQSQPHNSKKSSLVDIQIYSANA